MTYIVQLRNRTNLNEVTDQILLESNTDVEKFASLTNALFQKDSSYIFYYKNRRLVSTIEPIIQEFELNEEEVIFIDFIDEKDILADKVVELDDTVVSVCSLNSDVYYLTYEGDVFQLGKTEKFLNKFSHLVAGSNLIGADECRIFNVLKNEPIHTFEDHIRSISSFNELIAVATTSEVFIIDQSNFDIKKVADGQILPRSVTVHDSVLAWISNYNQINIYKLDTLEMNCFKTDCTVINLCIANDLVVATTSNNQIVTVSANKISNIQTDQRSIQFAIPSNNLFLLASQYNVLSCSFTDSSTISEHAFFKLKGNINGIASDSKNVYIANDNKITIYELNRFKSL